MSEIYLKRLEKLNDVMYKSGIDCVVLGNSTNLYYMTGFRPKKCERLLSAVFSIDSDPFLITSTIYAPEAGKSCSIQDIRPWKDGVDVNKNVHDFLTEKKIIGRKIALDPTMEFTWCKYFMTASPTSEFVSASAPLTELRMIKDADEIQRMRESAALTDEAIGMVIGALQLGKTEVELHTWIEYELRKRGMCQGFSNIIGFGVHSNSGHHVPTERPLQKGDQIVMDLGGGYHHYWSDVTRCAHIGKPSEKYLYAYQHVQESQRIAREAVKPGIRACDVDAVARNYLTKHGLGENFIHRLGHGVGLDGHEQPCLAPDDKTVLQPGMTFSCEPSAHFDGEWGLLVEDTVCVTETGCESFSKYPRELTIVEL